MIGSILNPIVNPVRHDTDKPQDTVQSRWRHAVLVRGVGRHRCRVGSGSHERYWGEGTLAFCARGALPQARPKSAGWLLFTRNLVQLRRQGMAHLSSNRGLHESLAIHVRPQVGSAGTAHERVRTCPTDATTGASRQRRRPWRHRHRAFSPMRPPSRRTEMNSGAYLALTRRQRRRKNYL